MKLPAFLAERQSDRANLLSGAVTGTIAMGLNKVSMLVVGLLFARMLGVEQYGVYGFCLALVPLAGLVVEFGMVPLVTRRTADAAARDNAKRIKRLSHSAYAVLLRNWAIAAMVGLPLAFISGLFDSEPMRVAIAVTALLVLASGLQRLAFSKLYALRKLLWAQFVESLIAPLAIVALALVAWFAFPTRINPASALTAHLFATVLAFAAGAYILHGVTRTAGAFMAKRIPTGKMLAMGSPFMLIGAAMALNTQVDTVIVGLLLGPYETGIYRVGAQIAIISVSITAVIGSICGPYFARYHTQRDLQRLRHLYRVSTLASFAALALFLIGLVVAGRLFLEFTFGPQFIGAYPIMTILTLGYLLNSLFGPAGTLLSMTGHERSVSKILWATGIANVIGSLAVARWFGALGVAAATAVTIVAYHALLRIVIKRKLGF